MSLLLTPGSFFRLEAGLPVRVQPNITSEVRLLLFSPLICLTPVFPSPLRQHVSLWLFKPQTRAFLESLLSLKHHIQFNRKSRIQFLFLTFSTALNLVWEFPSTRSALSPVLSCTPQACKPCTSPASRPKKEPGVSDSNGLIDGWSYTSGAKGFWRDIPPWTAGRRWAGQGSSSLCSWENRGATSYRRVIDIRLAIGYQGNQRRGTALSASWAKYLPGAEVFPLLNYQRGAILI